MAQLAHVDDARQAAQRRGQRKIWPLQCLLVPSESARGRKLSAAPANFPCAGERRQHGDGPHRCAPVFASLHPIVQTQRGGARGGVLARQLLDLARGHSGVVSDALRRKLAHALGQALEAMRHFRDVGAVFEALVEDHVHHAEGQRRIRSGTDGDVPVGYCGCPRAVGIDDDQPRSVAPRLLDEWPQVNVVAVDVRGPREDKIGQAEVFGWRAQLLSVDQVPCLPARFGTDGAVKLARPQAVKEAAIHGAVAEHADGSGVTVREDRFGAVPVADLVKPRSDRIERFVPARALECFVLAPALQRALCRSGFAAQRVENAVRRVDAIEILRHLAAQKAPRHRLRRVAFDLYRAAFLVHRHQHRARVRTIVRANGVHDAKGRGSSRRGHEAIIGQD